MRVSDSFLGGDRGWALAAALVFVIGVTADTLGFLGGTGGGAGGGGCSPARLALACIGANPERDASLRAGGSVYDDVFAVRAATSCHAFFYYQLKRCCPIWDSTRSGHTPRVYDK